MLLHNLGLRGEDNNMVHQGQRYATNGGHSATMGSQITLNPSSSSVQPPQHQQQQPPPPAMHGYKFRAEQSGALVRSQLVKSGGGGVGAGGGDEGDFLQRQHQQPPPRGAFKSIEVGESTQMLIMSDDHLDI